MARSADAEMRHLAEQLAGDWRDACRDALMSPKVKTKLAGLDSQEGGEVLLVLLGVGGVFMPLTGPGVQVAHGAVTLVAKEAKKELKNVRHSQAFYQKLIKLLNKAEIELSRRLARPMVGPPPPGGATAQRREIMSTVFKECYLDKRGSPWRLDKTPITGDVTRRICGTIDTWQNIPGKCRAEATKWREGSYWAPGIPHFDEVEYNKCIEKERRKLEQRLRHGLR
ncbi:MAG: hypothetical protein GVY33_11070 [Alphaproteobacteria bacterium]|jgi:hypothetical protein|nr:hypothetical protein [Alphaproteobacteria bacterium]